MLCSFLQDFHIECTVEVLGNLEYFAENVKNEVLSMFCLKTQRTPTMKCLRESLEPFY